jgi:cytochrome c oxidase cbb3-type subunit 2
MYDHPFQWGSKRTGPDLARVGGKYSDEWHRGHLVDPRSVVPESVMPPYAFLEKTELNFEDIAGALNANRMVGVPYTDDMIAKAKADLIAQATPEDEGIDAFSKRYPKAEARDFDGDPTRITEMDAVVAYMQMLGTLVDFKTYQADAPENRR